MISEISGQGVNNHITGKKPFRLNHTDNKTKDIRIEDVVAISREALEKMEPNETIAKARSILREVKMHPESAVRNQQIISTALKMLSNASAKQMKSVMGMSNGEINLVDKYA